MMEFIFIIIAGIWYLRIIQNILSYVHLWYVKEYRPDRMMIHLRTRQGSMILFPPVKRPPISPKAVVLTFGLVTVTFLLVLFLPVQILIRMLIVDLLTFPLSFLFVSFLQIPTMIYHAYVIRKATRMLRTHTPMTVIGITGSYGKTSTKEFLATIMSSRYNVLKTEASKNSPIGIAETVLKYLKPEHEVFVVEMGAYRPGEIKKMAQMVEPQIGVVTHINPQHQDLFRSLETTKKAKFELLASLGGKRIALCNADNPHTRTMASWAHKAGDTVWMFADAKTKIPAYVSKTFRLVRCSSTKESITLSVSEGKKPYTLTVPLRGEHFATNLVAAMGAAVAAGFSLKQAGDAAKQIKRKGKAMECVRWRGMTLINDTFNNNPDAARAALSYLAKYGNKRYMVFQPMIELGSYAESSHEAVGAYAATVCDEVILTNANFQEYFRKGFVKKKSSTHLHIMNTQEAAAYLKKHCRSGDTVLFKGKEAEFVLKEVHP